MAIEFNCPNCNAFYRLDDKFAGKMGKCTKCQKAILIPFRSTAGPDKAAPSAGAVDAEALAAAAFAEVAPPPEKVAEAQAAAKKIAVTCQHCDFKFEVDASMAGKNTQCPDCKKLIRVAKPVEDKPADWRSTASNKPSMAKSDEPVPSGAWETQRKGVSAGALIDAGAVEEEPEDDEDKRDRRIRRIKQGLYGFALLGIVVFLVSYLWKGRQEGKQEKWMDKAVAEMEDKNEGSKKLEYQAAIHRFAGEYYVRSAKNRDDLTAALKFFDRSRDDLQKLPPANPDRNAMLIELGLAIVVCGGDSKEIGEERRLPWDKVYPLIRKCLDKIAPTESELRSRSMRMLTRRLTEREQAMLAVTVARLCSTDADQSEMIGRVGIELFLIGKKDLAEQVLSKAPEGQSPALTALWLALHPDQDLPPKNFPHVAPPPAKGAGVLSRESRLAYAEGRALQGRMDDARRIAELPGGDRLEAIVHVAAAAVDTGRADVAAAVLEKLAETIKNDSKGLIAGSWLMERGVELAARANRLDIAQAILDLMKEDATKAWAKLEVLRIKLAAQRKEKADETWVEIIEKPEDASLASALARAEVARHNAAISERAYTKTVEAMPKGTIRPFGYAGTALGGQDPRPK